MTRRLLSLKRALLAISLIAAFSAAPALASGPQLTDAGSAFWTVRVDGANFTANSWAYVEVLDNGNKMDGWYQTGGLVIYPCGSGGSLFFLYLCVSQGDFSATIYTNFQCTGSRVVWAYDWSSGLWSNPVYPGCA